MSKKRVRFGSLKAGRKFRYNRKLHIKDDDGWTAVQLSNGFVTDFDNEILVTPVKVKITVI